MKFKINHIEYETEETNIKLIEFLKNNKLSFINNNLLKVEIENNEQLQNIKDVIIEDGMSLLTISDKIIDKLNSEIQTISKQVQQDEFKLSETCYNVLLCDSDIYEESLKLYSNCGFDDIINIKFASMIEFVERANEMLIKKTNELDGISQKPIVYSKLNIINYNNTLNTKILSDYDIATVLINNYYKKICNIEKNINIIYITNSLYKHLNNTINETRVNQTVLFNNVKLIETENKCKDLINNAIYLKESFDYTTNCSFIGYIKLFKQMGLKENRLEAISLDDNAKKITGVYQKINIVGLVTKVFPKLEEVIKYDYIYVLDDTEKLDYVNESEYLNDYNMNEIYKKVLDKPGNKFLMRK